MRAVLSTFLVLREPAEGLKVDGKSLFEISGVRYTKHHIGAYQGLPAKHAGLGQLSAHGRVFCPYCGQRIEYCFLNRTATHYLRHHGNRECDYRFFENETEEHEKGKQLLQEWLKNQFPGSFVATEWRLAGSQPQVADVYLKLAGQDRVIEFQCTPLSPSELEERRACYREKGVTDYWVVGCTRFEGWQEDRPLKPMERHLLEEFEKVVYLDADTARVHILHRYSGYRISQGKVIPVATTTLETCRLEEVLFSGQQNQLLSPHDVYLLAERERLQTRLQELLARYSPGNLKILRRTTARYFKAHPASYGIRGGEVPDRPPIPGFKLSSGLADLLPVDGEVLFTYICLSEDIFTPGGRERRGIELRELVARIFAFIDSFNVVPRDYYEFLEYMGGTRENITAVARECLGYLEARGYVRSRDGFYYLNWQGEAGTVSDVSREMYRIRDEWSIITEKYRKYFARENINRLLQQMSRELRSNERWQEITRHFNVLGRNNQVPPYLNLEVEGSHIIRVDRRLWQTYLFLKYIYSYYETRSNIVLYNSNLPCYYQHILRIKNDIIADLHRKFPINEEMNEIKACFNEEVVAALEEEYGYPIRSLEEVVLDYLARAEEEYRRVKRDSYERYKRGDKPNYIKTHLLRKHITIMHGRYYDRKKERFVLE